MDRVNERLHALLQTGSEALHPPEAETPLDETMRTERTEARRLQLLKFLGFFTASSRESLRLHGVYRSAYGVSRRFQQGVGSARREVYPLATP